MSTKKVGSHSDSEKNRTKQYMIMSLLNFQKWEIGYTVHTLGKIFPLSETL